MVCGNMETETSMSYMDQLYDEQPDKVARAVQILKNSLIGSVRHKEQLVEQGVLARLVNLLVDPEVGTALKTNVVHILASVCRGSTASAAAVIDAGVLAILLSGLVTTTQEERLTEACLLCLLAVLEHKEAPVEAVYADLSVVNHLVNFTLKSTNCQISVCRILALSCRTREQQTALLNAGAPQALCGVLSSPISEAQMAGLDCLAAMTSGNETLGAALLATTYMGKSLVSQIVFFTGREHREDIQLAASRILSYVYRSGALTDDEGVILYRVLPCLVRMCKKEESVENRILAAETLAYLIEVNVELQRTAAISNNLITTVSTFLKWSPEPHQKLAGLTKLQLARLNRRLEKEAAQARGLKTAAFKVFASLAANDEEIRKRLIETDHVVESVVAALQETEDTIKMAAIRCLHSLSRSVQLLRTTFQDHTVWQPLVKILNSPAAKAESLLMASSTLCNLLLDFSPSKEKILESGAVDLLCQLTHKFDPSLRLNGVWGLMNMSFNAEQKIKSQIMTTLGTDQVFRLLSDTEIQVVMKTLGLLRNLLSNDKQHIDHITNIYGKQLMQAVVFILESENNPEVKEQGLCLLANIADGDASKKLIVDNEDMLKKLKTYMVHNNTNLQTAAVVCIQNLIWKDEEGTLERQAKLKEIGVFKILHQLLGTTDKGLFEKVNLALQQISM